jgi:hypothetical protein
MTAADAKKFLCLSENSPSSMAFVLSPVFASSLRSQGRRVTFVHMSGS